MLKSETFQAGKRSSVGKEDFFAQCVHSICLCISDICNTLLWKLFELVFKTYIPGKSNFSLNCSVLLISLTLFGTQV